MRSWTLVSSATAPVALIGGWTLAQTHQPASYGARTDTIGWSPALSLPVSWAITQK